MKVSDFPFCCGIKLLTNFGNTNTAMDSTAYSKKDVEEWLDNRDYYKRNLKMIAINSDQVKKLGLRIFKKRGFKLVHKFHYSGHGNNIYILIKNAE